MSALIGGVVKLSAGVLIVVAVLGTAAAVYEGAEHLGTLVTSGAAATREGSRIVDDFDQPAGDETMDRAQASGDELVEALSAGAELVESVRDTVDSLGNATVIDDTRRWELLVLWEENAALIGGVDGWGGSLGEDLSFRWETESGGAQVVDAGQLEGDRATRTITGGSFSESYDWPGSPIASSHVTIEP